MIYTPNENEIERTMRDTGMDYIQARNHVISRAAVLERIAADHRAAVDRCLQSWAGRTKTEAA